MKISILKKTRNELRIEVEGAGHTFCNSLHKVLLEDDTIDMAGYNISHPLVSQPIFYIRTKGRRNPETTLLDAIKRLKAKNKKLRIRFKNALKEWDKSGTKNYKSE